MSGEGFPSEPIPGVTIDLAKEMGWLSRDQADALRARVSELEAERASLYERMLLWRGIDVAGGEKPCKRCDGSGRRSYGDTTTWRGGSGGQTVTADVCDRCWGSGVAGKPWPSHRLLRNLMGTSNVREGGK